MENQTLKNLRNLVKFKCADLTLKTIKLLSREELIKILTSGKCPSVNTCKADEILNPATQRCVKRDGKIGQKIQKEQSAKSPKRKSKSPKRKSKSPKRCKATEILNPATQRCVKRDGKIGQKIQKEQNEGHEERKSGSPKKRKSPQNKGSRCLAHEILNPYTGRCINKHKAGKNIFDDYVKNGYDESADRPFLIKIKNEHYLLPKKLQITKVLEIPAKFILFGNITDYLIHNFSVEDDYDIQYTDEKDISRYIKNAHNLSIPIWNIAKYNAVFTVYKSERQRRKEEAEAHAKYANKNSQYESTREERTQAEEHAKKRAEEQTRKRAEEREKQASANGNQNQAPGKNQTIKTNFVCNYTNLAKIFGVPNGKNISHKDYLKWSLKNHPDKNPAPNATALFQEVSSCWTNYFKPAINL